VLDWTDNDSLAGVADLVVAKPLAILVIVVVALIVVRIGRRLARRSVRRVLTGKDGRRHDGSRRPSKSLPTVLQRSSANPLRLEARSETLSAVAASFVSILVWLVAAVAILGVLEINLAPLLASAGIAGVALGFGAQTVVGDFLAGIFIITEDQYGVGDIVDLGDAIGTVEKVSLRVTRIRDLDGTVWHVPNGEIKRVANMSQEWSRVLLDVDVAYETDLDLAIDVLRTTAERMSGDTEWMTQILETPEVWGVESFGADGIAIRMVIKTKPGAQFNVTRELRRRIKYAFDEEGIDIPFPQRTLWIRGEHDGGLEGGSGDGDGSDPSGDQDLVTKPDEVPPTPKRRAQRRAPHSRTQQAPPGYEPPDGG
jgi:small conductance mechanosensitive channel